MTYEKFCEIWNKAFPNGYPRPSGENVLHMEGSSERTQKALIAYANGDTSYFDEARAKLAELHRQ